MCYRLPSKYHYNNGRVIPGYKETLTLCSLLSSCWHQFQTRAHQAELRLRMPISNTLNKEDDKDVVAMGGEKVSEAAEAIEVAQLM